MHEVKLFLYNENQFLVPNGGKIFGSTWDNIVFPMCNRNIGCHRKFQISRIHWKAMDCEAQRCDETGEVPNTTHCILGFIRDKVGCHIPIHNMEPLGKPLCHTPQQFENILTLMTQLIETDDDSEVYRLTGCLSSCKKVIKDDSSQFT